MGDESSQAPQLNAAGQAIMAQYGTSMSSTQVMKKTPTRDEFEEEVAKLPTEWAVRLCGFLECLRDEPERLGIDIQTAAIDAFVPGAIRKEVMDHYRKTGQMFVFEEQLLGIIRFAILKGQEAAPDILTADQQRAFFRALLYYGDLHSAEIGEIDGPDDAARMEMRGLAFGATEVAGNVMARAYALWLDIPAELTGSPFYTDVDREFAHATQDHPLSDYFTIFSVALTHRGDVIKGSVWESLMRWPFDPKRFASSKRADELAKSMRALAADRREMSDLITKEMPKTPEFLGVAMMPFVHRPLYATKDGKFLIISMRLMIDGLYDLAYWRVWEHLERDHGSEGPPLRAKFTQFYGLVLERYVLKLLQSQYDTPDTKRVFPESEAQPPQGAPDVAIFLDDRVILVEVTKTDLRYFETLLKGDLAGFDKDFARTADKANQLAKATARFQSGEIKYSGHEGDVTLPVEQIVIVPNPIPRFPFMSQRTSAALTKAEVAPDATIISVGELEEALVAGELKGLSETIEAWKTSELADTSLHNFIRIKRSVIEMNKRAPYLSKCAEALRRLVIERMSFKPEPNDAPPPA
jgi:hypothetical protein